MASLAIGLVGGVLFGPVGFLVGSLIGNLLFPQKQQPIANLKPQDSSYGAMIPISYGTVRSTGQIIWTTDLQQHSHHGSKGGPTILSYSASFAVKICKGPIAALLQIYANGTLVYDATSSGTVNNSAVPVTIYLGVESALPDPTMEGIIGVGDVPAFRDDFVCVFENWDFSDYGNTWPQLSFVYATNTGTIPFRVSSYTPYNGFARRTEGVTYDQNTGIVTAGTFVFDGAPGWHYYERQSLIDGTSISTFDAVIDHIEGFVATTTSGGSYNSQTLFGANSSENLAGWFDKNVLVTDLSAIPLYNSGNGPSRWGSVVTDTDGSQSYVIPKGNPPEVWKYTWDGTSPGMTPALTWASPSGGNVANYDTYPSDSNGLFYVAWDNFGGASTDVVLWEINVSTLTVNRQWTNADIPHSSTAVYPLNGQGVVFYNGLIAYTSSGGGFPNDSVRVYQIQDAGTPWVFVGSTPLTGVSSCGLVRFSNGLCLTTDGVISLDPPIEDITLAEIVADLSERAGLTSGQIDVTDLTPIVPGYMVTQRTDTKSDIDPLRTAYFFDATESNGTVKFILRGNQPALTIPDNDLAAQQISEAPPALMQVKRTQEIDLPTQVNVTYIDFNASYQKGTQEARRMATDAFTDSGGPSTVDLAICMDTNKARQIANVLLYGTWIERNSFVFSTSRKYDYLEPTDVIIAHGYTLRITKKTETLVGTIQFEGVENVPAIYAQQPTSGGGSGGGPITPPISQSTQLLLLDIPLITDTDDADGIYAAMAGATDDTWTGAGLYKSADGGVTYTQVGSLLTPSVIGTASTALPVFGNANIFDQTNSVTVVIGVGGGELSNANELAVLNGANEALLGSEIIQFENADLTAPSTYLLSGLLRGRRGTEWAQSTHIVGENFVLLPDLDVPLAFSELGQDRMYKPVSFGQSLAQTLAQTFTDLGVRLRCYSPADLGGGVINGSGDVLLDWTRRTRIGGAWLDYVDVPLSETTEAYVVQIWDATYTLCARIINCTTPSVTYTGAQQTTDFGGHQAHIYFTVGQLGSYGLGSQTQGVGIGSGGSDNAPTSPITPYIWVPTVPPPGPTAPVNGTITWPSDSIIIPMTVGQRFVYQFTTGGTIPNTGTIAISEYQSQLAQRRCFIATDTGGLSPVAHGLGYGTTATSFIGATDGGAVLAASTTYYFIFDFVMANGQLGGTPGANAETILNLGNVT